MPFPDVGMVKGVEEGPTGPTSEIDGRIVRVIPYVSSDKNLCARSFDQATHGGAGGGGGAAVLLPEGPGGARTV